MVDQWTDFRSRGTVRGASRWWPEQNMLDTCRAISPDHQAECSRWSDHEGRHMASLGRAWGYRVVSAWPGTHRPRKADLE